MAIRKHEDRANEKGNQIEIFDEQKLWGIYVHYWSKEIHNIHKSHFDNVYALSYFDPTYSHLKLALYGFCCSKAAFIKDPQLEKPKNDSGGENSEVSTKNANPTSVEPFTAPTSTKSVKSMLKRMARLRGTEEKPVITLPALGDIAQLLGGSTGRLLNYRFPADPGVQIAFMIVEEVSKEEGICHFKASIDLAEQMSRAEESEKAADMLEKFIKKYEPKVAEEFEYNNDIGRAYDVMSLLVFMNGKKVKESLHYARKSVQIREELSKSDPHALDGEGKSDALVQRDILNTQKRIIELEQKEKAMTKASRGCCSIC